MFRGLYKPADLVKDYLASAKDLVSCTQQLDSKSKCPVPYYLETGQRVLGVFW
jgi:hypothetical protein